MAANAAALSAGRPSSSSVDSNTHGSHASHQQRSEPLPIMTDEMKQLWAFHYFGYPAFASWMASSRDFFLLRRFSTSAARSLLYLQHRIAILERTLNQLDEKSKEQPQGNAGINCIDGDPFSDRAALIEQLGTMLQKYYDLVNAFAQVKSIPTARPRQVQNLYNWFDTYPDAVVESEQHFRNHESDLFPVQPVISRSPLRQLLGRSLWLKSLFTPTKKADRFESDSTLYSSSAGMDVFTSVVIVVTGLCLLFGPLWWLNFVRTANYRLAIITAFVSVFTVWLWLAAGQRPFEILAASAAYAAVLVVYLQSNA